MKKRDFGKVLAGGLIGATLGVLFAPKAGKETRRELKEKMDELAGKAKEISVDEVTEMIETKISELKEQIADLDREKVLQIAKDKALLVKEKAQELVDLAVDKGTPVLRDAASEVKAKALKVCKEAVARLEEKEPKKEIKETKEVKEKNK